MQRILKEEGLRFVQAVGRGEESVSAPPLDGQRKALPPAKVSDDFSGHRPINIGEAAPSPLPGLLHSALQELQLALEELFECDRVLNSLMVRGEQAQTD